MMKKTERSSSLLQERYTCIEHPSGLMVYVFPKKLTTTYALFATRYGSIDSSFCPEGKEPITVPDGIAHFLEHKLFENEDGSDAFGRFSALGADANAYTSYQKTAYLFSCTENFEAALSELLRFVTHPHFTKESVERECGIIAEEIRMYEDNPWDRAQRMLLCGLYHRHPVQNNICGSLSSIKRITPELLYLCHKVFYNPSNMALIVCGDVDPDCIIPLVDEALRDLPKKSGGFTRILPMEPDTVAKKEISCKMQVSKPLFYIGIKDPILPPTPKERLRRDAAMTLLDEVLFSRSGDLYNALFEEGLITPAFFGGYSCTDSFAYHCISGEADEPSLILARVKEYIGQVMEHGIDPETLERCRRVLYADELRAFDSTEEIANRLLSFVFDDAEIFSYPELLKEITREELEILLRESFREEYYTLSTVYPLESPEKETTHA